ncbi:magnesium transporter [Maricaulis virginensis]|uniref:Magnesium transporter MgtE n=1 Tax=Maricaulis virginensis TaxID=144022 RepID=A0A9W6IJY7_9PROT|nr:magnesium transporter [Maricaulis virginensis]GLK50962.1 magnesium transporter MgtE [Maricaulis virginensis]
MGEAAFEDDLPVDSHALADVDPEFVGNLRQAIADRDGDAIRRMLAPLHAADIADVLEQLTAGQQEGVATLAPDVFTGEVLAEIEPDTREVVMAYLDPSHLAAAIQELDSDDATEVVEELDPETRAAVLAEISEIDRQAVEQSLAFEDETAGRLMQREFVAAPEFWSVGHALDHMRASDDLPDKFHDLFVIDTGFRPVGEIPVCRLLSARRDVALSDLMEPPRILVDPETDQEEVAYLFQKYHLVSAPVVDSAGRLTGMLTLDDIVHVIQDENKEDMLALAGVNEAGLADTVVRSVRSRAPWLLVNLATAVLASGVIALFEGAISQVVALAVLMPIVASMGGNAGTQSLAVAVRSIAERDLTAANAMRVIWRELATGAVNGLIFAVVMGAVTILWFQDVALASVIAIAMVLNLACAGLSGILVPLGLVRAGADPAVASSVFVTTVTDVVGFLAFLGLATLVLL